jgi:hypothetical protein
VVDWPGVDPEGTSRAASKLARHLLHGTFDDLIPYVGVAVRAAPKLGVVLEVIVVSIPARLGLVSSL